MCGMILVFNEFATRSTLTCGRRVGHEDILIKMDVFQSAPAYYKQQIKIVLVALLFVMVVACDGDVPSRCAHCGR